MPLLFVVLWSTGFIGAKFGLPYAEPFTFLFIRFALTLALLVPLAHWLSGEWPRGARLWGHIAVSGLLVHGAYLGGVFYGIYLGMPAGLASLLVGLQPLLTAGLAGPLLGERLGGRQWLGLGLAGAGAVDRRHPAADGADQARRGLPGGEPLLPGAAGHRPAGLVALRRGPATHLACRHGRRHRGGGAGGQGTAFARRQAAYLNSGILPKGSSAGLVSRLAAAST